MKIEELIKALKDFKSKVPEDAVKVFDEIINGSESVQTAFNDQFGELKDAKGVVQEIKSKFKIEESTPLKEVASKAVDKLDVAVKEKDSLGQSADDHVKQLADLKTQFENLKGDFTKSQDDLKIKDEQLADKSLSSKIREAWKGDAELYTFAEGKIKDLINTNPDSKVEDVVSKFLEENPRFQAIEQKPGPGGELPNPGGNTKPLTALEIMQEVSAGNK